MQEPPSIMTLDELSEYLQLHPLTVNKLARAGQLPVFKMGWQWRVQRETLDEWLVQKSLANLKRKA